MRHYVVCVFDSAAGYYGQPYCAPSKGVALRSFADEVNRPGDQNQWNKHPTDFLLYCLGEYDDHEPAFKLLDSPELICRAADVLIK